jgi:glycosyltransferase involved in cell wall biosynthesis
MRFLTILMSGSDRMLKERLGMMLKAKYCNTVLAVSPTLATALQASGTHAVWLPPPVPDEYFASPRDGHKAKAVVSFLGRIDPNKGLHEVSAVFESLSRTNRFDLRIKGYYVPDNPESVQLHERLQRLAGVEYSAEAQDSCYDPRREQDVLRFLLQTDILVLPYRNLTGTLGLPLIVLEGLAARCLVISRDIGDISRIVASTGLLMHGPGDLREKLERLSSVEAVEAERACLDTSSIFSTFAATRVVDRLMNCF